MGYLDSWCNYLDENCEQNVTAGKYRRHSTKTMKNRQGMKVTAKKETVVPFSVLILSMKLILAVLALSLLLSFVAATNTYAQAIQYAKTHPKRDGGSWAGWCASLMVRAGDLPDWAVRPSAISAYRSSKIVSGDYNAAPPGSFHWWDIGADGHVAMATVRLFGKQ